MLRYGANITLLQRAVAFAIGIACAYILNLACPIWLIWILMTSLALAAALVVYRLQIKAEDTRAKVVTVCLLALWFSLGLLRMAGQAWCGVDASQLIGQSLTGQGKIIAVSDLASQDQAIRRLQIEIKIQEAKQNSEVVAELGAHKVSVEGLTKLWYKQKRILLILELPANPRVGELLVSELEQGARLAFAGRAQSITPPSNPGAFDYPAYLAAQGIYCRILGEPTQIKVLRPANLVSKMIQQIRRDLRLQIWTYLPEVEAGIVEGCLLGLTDRMTAQNLNAYRRSGIAHQFAVSGSHGTLILSLAAFIDSLWPGRYKPGRRWCFSVLILLFYVALTGFPTAMLRTLIMSVIMLTAEILQRKGDSLTAWALALLMLLWWQPGNLFLAGFQLSFGVVAGLIRFTPWLKKMGCPTIIVVPLAAQLSGMPLQAFWFNQLQLFGFLINLVTALLLGPVVILSLVAAFLSRILPTLAAGFWLISGFFAWWMHQAAVSWSDWSWACLAIAGKPWPLYCIWTMLLWVLPETIYYYKVFLNWLWDQSDRLQTAFKLALISLVCLVILLIGLRGRPLEVVFLDVGEGDCAVIHTPGGQTWLIDGGGTPFSSYETGLQVVLPYLHYRGINRISGIVLTHHHEDHREGIKELLMVMPVEQLWMPPLTEPDADDQAFLETATVSASQVQIISSFRARLEIEKGIYFNIWWPQAWAEADELVQWQGNNSSLIVGLKHVDQQGWLFAGDSEMLGLDTLLEHTKAEELRAAILKLPHHGSLSSFSPALYETVQPSGVVVTGGTRRSGNLGSEIQSWFAQAGLPMWRTRQQGAILTKEYHRNYVVTTVL